MIGPRASHSRRFMSRTGPGPSWCGSLTGPVGDMNLREWLALGPIMALCLLLGVYPQPVLDTAGPDLAVVSNLIARSLAHGSQPVGLNGLQPVGLNGEERR